MFWEKVIVEYLLLDVGINLCTISVMISLQSLTKFQSLSRFSRIIEKLEERGRWCDEPKQNRNECAGGGLAGGGGVIQIWQIQWNA
jgi:hypothetical protein